MSATIKAWSKGKKGGAGAGGRSAFRGSLEAAESERAREGRGQDVRRLSASPVSASAFFRIRLRGANGPNSHRL